MQSVLIDLTGKRFGRLLIVSRAEHKKSVRWNYQCDCGKIGVAYGTNLKRGLTKSCGCLRSEIHRTHGQSSHALFKTWKGMMSRCYDESHVKFKNYGGRGITVCLRWHTPTNFIHDMGERPEGKTLDRINNAFGYFPENCRWATITEQNNNKRNTPSRKTA